MDDVHPPPRRSSGVGAGSRGHEIVVPVAVEIADGQSRAQEVARPRSPAQQIDRERLRAREVDSSAAPGYHVDLSGVDPSGQGVTGRADRQVVVAVAVEVAVGDGGAEPVTALHPAAERRLGDDHVTRCVRPAV